MQVRGFRLDGAPVMGGISDVMRCRHWPIGLIYDNHTISASIRPTAPASGSGLNIPVAPLKLILHLASPPTEKLLLSPSAESCKQAFMGQLKEADFIRWGNTKRMTGLRKAEQDGMWEGIKEREHFSSLGPCALNRVALAWLTDLGDPRQ